MQDCIVDGEVVPVVDAGEVIEICVLEEGDTVAFYNLSARSGQQFRVDDLTTAASHH